MLRNMASVYIFHRDQVLMLYRIGSRVVAPSWCGIGGHFEAEELNDPRRCVLRELWEETGIPEEALCNLALRYISLRLKNDEIRQNYFFFADLQRSLPALPACDEGILAWIPVQDVLGKDMPHSARACLAHYLETGRTDTRLYGGVATPAGVDFTVLSEF